jgi:hypothetical protein
MEVGAFQISVSLSFIIKLKVPTNKLNNIKTRSHKNDIPFKEVFEHFYNNYLSDYIFGLELKLSYLRIYKI